MKFTLFNYIRKHLKKIIIIFSLCLICILAAGIYTWYDISTYSKTPINDDAIKVTFMVHPGQDLKTTIHNLVDAGLIRYPLKFELYARVCGYDKQIKAGEYSLSPSMSPDRILNLFVTGKVRLYRLTVPEGYTMVQIAKLVALEGLAKESDFMKAATDADYVHELGIDGDTFEGYLFPDTYYFPKGVTPKQIIHTMVKRFNRIFVPQWEQQAEQNGFTRHQIVILASMIEKETGNPKERAIISSVFHNRLKKRMRLESDPTVIYGIKNFDGNLTKKDLKTKTPYNTYRIKGLPHGPISNPGKDSIYAAIYPETTDYLYFVAKKDGNHHFSSNIMDHNHAVYKHQILRRRHSKKK